MINENAVVLGKRLPTLLNWYKLLQHMSQHKLGFCLLAFAVMS